MPRPRTDLLVTGDIWLAAYTSRPIPTDDISPGDVLPDDDILGKPSSTKFETGDNDMAAHTRPINTQINFSVR